MEVDGFRISERVEIEIEFVPVEVLSRFLELGVDEVHEYPRISDDLRVLDL